MQYWTIVDLLKLNLSKFHAHWRLNASLNDLLFSNNDHEYVVFYNFISEKRDRKTNREVFVDFEIFLMMVSSCHEHIQFFFFLKGE